MMTTAFKEKIILKLIGVVASIGIAYSLIWVLVLYFLGWLCLPFEFLGLFDVFSFQWFVIVILALIIVLLIKKGKSKLRNIILQDIVLCLCSLPFYSMFLSVFKLGIDDHPQKVDSFWIMIVLTIITININDWIKLRRQTLDT